MSNDLTAIIIASCFIIALLANIFAFYLKWRKYKKLPKVGKAPYTINPGRQGEKFIAETMGVTVKRLRKLKKLNKRITQVPFEKVKGIAISHPNPNNAAPKVSVYDDKGNQVKYKLGIRSRNSFWLDFEVKEPINGVVMWMDQ